jgi:hypothetical protein
MDQKQIEFLSKKHEREPINDDGELEDMNLNSQKKIKNNDDITEQKKETPSLEKEISLEPTKIMKTIEKIKNETIEKFNELSPEEKKDNVKLKELASDFDIIEIINMKILENDINQNNTKEFIEDYKKLRYTIETKNRITLLNKYKKISPGNKIQDFNVSYESKEPKQLLQRFLLDLIELYNKCLDESVLKPAQFYDYFSSIMGREGYDIGKAFFGPGNFGNSNLKFSLLFSEFLTIFDAIKFDENKNQVKDHFIKNRFERKLVLLKLFYTTIKNENNILNSELYYKYLKIINTILLMCAKTRNTVSVKNMIILINNCMINLI